MSIYFDLTTADQCDTMELFSFYDESSMDFFNDIPGLKSIIKKRSAYEKDPTEKYFGKCAKRSVVFRDPICEVRLYDKVAAKRQQWGHAKRFGRVKRFCWDNTDDDRKANVAKDSPNRWLPSEEDQDYRLMMWRDMQKRRLNRKRRVTGDSLAYLVQGLEISPNCIEEVASKMRKTEDRV